jgi:hypothetical protein
LQWLHVLREKTITRFSGIKGSFPWVFIVREILLFYWLNMKYAGKGQRRTGFSM